MLDWFSICCNWSFRQCEQWTLCVLDINSLYIYWLLPPKLEICCKPLLFRRFQRRLMIWKSFLSKTKQKIQLHEAVTFHCVSWIPIKDPLLRWQILQFSLKISVGGFYLDVYIPFIFCNCIVVYLWRPFNTEPRIFRIYLMDKCVLDKLQRLSWGFYIKIKFTFWA